jgi:hypothetical protein
MTHSYILKASLRTGNLDAAAIQSGYSEIENMNWFPGYAEPGYCPPRHGVLVANWNLFPARVFDLLERYGYGTEWSDEWTGCDECGRIVRIHADSHWWSPSYVRDRGNYTVTCWACVRDEDRAYARAAEFDQGERGTHV